MIIILTLLNLLLSVPEIAERISPIRFKENIKLKGYEVSQTYKLTESDLFIIAKPSKYELDNEGYRLIHLSLEDNKYTVKSESKPKGEAYVYTPSFFKFSANEYIILVEEGYEYNSGFDVFTFNSNELKLAGVVPVVGTKNSIIDQLSINKQTENYLITFRGQIEFNPPSDEVIAGNRIKIFFDDNGIKIEKIR